MSANNYLLIKEYRKNRFRIEDKDVETGSGFSIHPLYTIKRLREAIQIAQDYMKEEIVEYGISFKLIKTSQTG